MRRDLLFIDLYLILFYVLHACFVCYEDQLFTKVRRLKLKEKSSQKNVFVVYANKILALSLATYRSFSAGFPCEISLQRSPKFEHRCRHVEQYSEAMQAAFSCRSFVQEMASEAAFNYHSGLWLLLSHIILRQTWSRLRNNSIEDGEVKKSLGEKDAKSAARFSPCRQFRVGPNDAR